MSVLGASQQVPDDATAVALNVTAVTPDGSGFITVYPCGVTRPLASSLNYIAGDIVANNVMAPIGDDGAVCLYTSSPSDVLVDISGWFQGVTNNEFVGTTPKRLVDTRDSTGPAPVSSSDIDGDGVIDVNDAFPDIPLGGLTDTDGDGLPNVCDAACQTAGMTADADDDADGIVDTVDGYPLVSIGTLLDTDADGRPNDCDSACQELGMAADTDDDGDNSPDADDGFPLISTGILLDTDLDGIPDDCDSACLQLGMLADADDDADGVLDYEDPFPKDGTIFMAREIPSIIEFLR